MPREQLWLSPGPWHQQEQVPIVVLSLPCRWWAVPQKQGAPGSVPWPAGVTVSLPSHRGPLCAHSAAVGVGFYGNSETNDGVFQLLYALDHANQTLTGIDSLVGPPGCINPLLWVWFQQGGMSGRSGRALGVAVLCPAREGDVTHRMGPLWPSRAGPGPWQGCSEDGHSLDWGGAALLEKAFQGWGTWVLTIPGTDHPRTDHPCGCRLPAPRCRCREGWSSTWHG